MFRIPVAVVSAIIGVVAVVPTPVARAEETVTYEVGWGFVPVVAGIEYPGESPYPSATSSARRTTVLKCVPTGGQTSARPPPSAGYCKVSS